MTTKHYRGFTSPSQRHRGRIESALGIVERDTALQANGFAPMGDLSAALQAR